MALEAAQSRNQRNARIDPEHDLPITRQCQPLGVSRSSMYYQTVATPERERRFLEPIDKSHTDKPSLGNRRIIDELVKMALTANPKRVQRLTRLMGNEAIYQPPRTSHPRVGNGHRVFP